MKRRFLSCCAALWLSAAAGAGGNLFPQGDFERDPKGGWHLPSPEWRIEDGAGYAGSRGLVFDLGKGSKTVKWPWTDKVAVEPLTPPLDVRAATAFFYIWAPVARCT